MSENVIPLDTFRSRSLNVVDAPSKSREKRERRSFGTIRQLPSGMWQASYVVPERGKTGKSAPRYFAPVTFRTKGDADKWLATRQAELLEHRWKPTPPMEPDPTLFEDYAREWLSSKKNLKPRTRSEYEKTLNKLIKHFGHFDVQNITQESVQQWWESRDDRYPSARKHEYDLLRGIVKGALKKGLIKVDPCQVDDETDKAPARRIRPATVEQIDLIAYTVPPRYKALVLISAWCALRFGESTALQRRNIELDMDSEPPRGIIHVKKAVTWPKGIPTLGTPKTASGNRTVAIPPHIVADIYRHLEEYAQPGETGLLFPSTQGGYLQHASLYKVFKRARLSAGRPDLRWHDLRHTGATLAAQSGATLADLMMRLGHSTVSAAMIYQHATEERDAELARRMSATVTGGT